MDKTFLITQVINTVLIIVTTIIVTRVTVKGSFGISQKTKDRLKTIAIIVIVVVWLGASSGWSVWKLFILVTPNTPPSRLEVMAISFNVSILTIYLFLLGAAATSLIEFYRRRHKVQSS